MRRPVCCGKDRRRFHDLGATPFGLNFKYRVLSGLRGASGNERLLRGSFSFNATRTFWAQTEVVWW
jgi:hypothetical protein